jgi:hypothetical protein
MSSTAMVLSDPNMILNILVDVHSPVGFVPSLFKVSVRKKVEQSRTELEVSGLS